MDLIVRGLAVDGGESCLRGMTAHGDAADRLVMRRACGKLDYFLRLLSMSFEVYCYFCKRIIRVMCPIVKRTRQISI
jgi:hypothetical protein